MIAAKICGLSDAKAVDAAVLGGAAYVGFVFFEPSPRNIAPERAVALMHRVPAQIVKVGLFVDPDDEFLRLVLHHANLDLLQLHGKETPSRAAAIRKQFNRPVMKALALANDSDFETAKTYASAVVSVRDNGPGIPSESLLKVFDPFFTTKPPGRGTGLGLWISWNIVKDHGGFIEAGNHPEGGAVVLFTLPLAQKSAQRSAVSRQQEKAEG